MSFSITRRFQFCAGHRVFGHEGKCAHPHGHNYVMYATVVADSLDEVGRVIDFSVVKDVLGKWIDAQWDHGFIFFYKDALMFQALSTEPNWKVYSMLQNPTAENMARHILLDVCPDLFQPHGVRCVKIVLEETENCSATVEI